MGQILQTRDGRFSLEPKLACGKSKPCYNRARLLIPLTYVKRKIPLHLISEVAPNAMSSDAESYLKIGDVSRIVGISPSAIRGWESLGLTRPRRTESRYRLYSKDDVRQLKRRATCARCAD
jgi:hypothetical protein